MTVPMERLGREATAGHPSLVPSAAPEDTLPPLDKAHIDQLRAAIGATRVEGLLGLLAKELAERPALIRNAVVCGDVARARHESHSFKGATLSVGALALGRAAARIEGAGDLAAMATALASLDRQASRTLHAITSLLPSYSSGRETS